MSAEPFPDDSPLDRPDVLAYLFYPRSSFARDSPDNIRDLAIPVAEGVAVGARCHLADAEATNILFFHGNGEIAEDYDDLGPLFARCGINFWVAVHRTMPASPRGISDDRIR